MDHSPRANILLSNCPHYNTKELQPLNVIFASHSPDYYAVEELPPLNCQNLAESLQ